MNRYPVRLEGRLDAPGRWLWLVKWLLLIPHIIVLFFLGAAFVVLTLVAYLAVLFTGSYPRAIFDFNVGVLRWSWRVGYYGYQALGTDRYPPFTLAEVPDYPASLTIDYPPRPARWLPLVAWLLALPQLMIIAALNSNGGWELYRNESGQEWVSSSAGLLGILVLVAGAALLFTGRQPRGLHDLLVGIARWTVRVVAFVALLTEVYPPFRLDQGEREPDDGPDDRPSPHTGSHRTGQPAPEPEPATSSGAPA